MPKLKLNGKLNQNLEAVLQPVGLSTKRNASKRKSKIKEFMHASKEEPAPSSKNSKKAPFGKDYLEVMRNFNLPEL